VTRRASLGTFRWHLVLTSVCVAIVFAVIAATTLFVPLFVHLDGNEFTSEEMGGIAGYILHLHATFWPVVAGSLLASVASGILLFERMRSPLVRFVAAYAELEAGRIPRQLEIRTRDYLQDEADALNRLIGAERCRRAALLREIERLHHALAEASQGDPSAKSRQALAEAEEAVEALRSELEGGA
jgi:hypothetical protein